jgi:hypothetical protein
VVNDGGGSEGGRKFEIQGGTGGRRWGRGKKAKEKKTVGAWGNRARIKPTVAPSGGSLGYGIAIPYPGYRI